MHTEDFRVLKHDLLSDLGSIFSALKMISSSESSENSKEILNLILKKEDKIKENLNDLLNEVSRNNDVQ